MIFWSDRGCNRGFKLKRYSWGWNGVFVLVRGHRGRHFWGFGSCRSYDYGNTGYGVSSPRIQNKKKICLKINIPKGNYWILRIGVVASCQKLVIILLIKWFKNWCYQKICAQKLVFFNEKKIRKIPMIFDIENWLCQSQILALCDTSPSHQFSKFNNFLWGYVDF